MKQSPETQDSSAVSSGTGERLGLDPHKTAKPTSQTLVWDLPVRVFHWALVISFAASFVTNWLGVNYFIYHLWFGYATLVLVAFRILWGVAGNYHARFHNFVRSPLATAKYAISLLKGQDKPYLGHNPLGAVMVIMLLLTLLVQAITGLFANDEIMNAGPLYGYISNELSLNLTGLHQTLFYWILAAVVLHIAAVLFHVKYKKENLVQAMIHGKKPSNHQDNVVIIHRSRIGLALALLGVVVAVLAWVIATAPEVVVDFGY